MSTKKGNVLTLAVVFVMGIILIASSLTLWYFIVSPVVGLNTYNLEPGTAGQKSLGASSHTIYVNTVDAGGATSNIVNITPKNVFAVSIAPLLQQMNSGESQLFTSTIKSGSGNYTYQWYFDNAPVAGATNSTWTYTATDTGYHTAYLNLADTSTNAKAISNIAKITPKNTFALSISPALAQLNQYQIQFYISKILNGTGGPYTYQWYLDGNPIKGAILFGMSYNATTVGYHTLYANVVDTSGVNSNAARITKPGFAVSITPAFVTMEAGQTQQFTATLQGGTEPYRYQWYFDNTTIANKTSSSFTYNATTAGVHTVYVSAIDNNGFSTTSNIAGIAKPGFAASITPASATMDNGQTQQFTATPQGGSGTYTYKWYLDNKNVTNVTTTPTFNYTAAYDSPNLLLYFGGLIFNQQPVFNTSRPVDHAFDLSIKITASGPVNVTIYQHDNPVFSKKTDATHKTLMINSTAGMHTVYANITDSAGANTISNVARITLKSELSVSISPSFTFLDVGQGQVFSSTVTNGIAPYTYQWYLDNRIVVGATSPTWNYTQTTPISHSIYVSVTDSAGANTVSNIARTTKPGFAASIAPSSAAMYPGEWQIFNSTVQAGSGNYTYQWYMDGKKLAGATNSILNFTDPFDPSTIYLPNVEGTISSSLLDAFSGGITPYVIIQNLDLASSTSVTYQYSYNALFRESQGIPLFLLLVGVVMALVSGIALVRRLIKRVRQR